MRSSRRSSSPAPFGGYLARHGWTGAVIERHENYCVLERLSGRTPRGPEIYYTGYARFGSSAEAPPRPTCRPRASWTLLHLRAMEEFLAAAKGGVKALPGYQWEATLQRFSIAHEGRSSPRIQRSCRVPPSTGPFAAVGYFVLSSGRVAAAQHTMITTPHRHTGRHVFFRDILMQSSGCLLSIYLSLQ